MITEDIKNQVSVRMLLDHYGIGVDRRGFARCPFHGGDQQSLKVYDGSETWFCYGCGLGGDVITFVELYEDVSLSDAVKYIAAHFPLKPKTKQQITDFNYLMNQKAYWEGVKSHSGPEYDGGEIFFPPIWLKACRRIPEIELELEIALLEYGPEVNGCGPAGAEKPCCGS